MFTFLSRYSKTIAWFFTGVLYLELLLTSVDARAHVVMRRETIDVRSSPLSPLTSDVSRTDNKHSQPLINDVDQQNYKPETTNQKQFTGGPTQPEMQSFSAVNANNMVDLFTGDFSYNIPLLDVGGYPVNLHYNSGITMDQEASWVGLGWNINPGTVSRNMRGLPDDFGGDKDQVTKTLHVKDNRTIGLTFGFDLELFGLPASLGITTGSFHNNYKGWGQEIGLSAGFSAINSGRGPKGGLTAGLSVTNNSQSGLNISPSLGLVMGSNENRAQGSVSVGANYNSRAGLQSLQITGEMKRNRKQWMHSDVHPSGSFQYGAGISSSISFSRPSYTPTIAIPYTSQQLTFTAKIGGEVWGLDMHGLMSGNGSIQYIHKNDVTATHPAFGYLYYEKSIGNDKALLDFNREKDVAYTEQSPHIAIPVYTYDTWSITGEGTGGMFRAYRGDIGFVHDHKMVTRSDDNNISTDFAFGSLFHVGADFTKIYSWTESKPWLGDNAMKDMIPFTLRDTTYENVYFKNPGEKTAVNEQYMNAIGGDKLMRVDLLPEGDSKVPVITAGRTFSLFNQGKRAGKITMSKNVLRKERDKRTQVISFLTAADAATYGLDRKIRSYNINSFPVASCNTNFQILPRMNLMRQPNHISEITVLNNDGRRYIYGTPVYNVEQVDVNMSTATGDQQTGLVGYDTTVDNSVDNRKGKEAFFKEEVVSPYSHAFLLSGILSPDYHDITGDGITEDDPGDAVKFNYSRVYGEANAFQWRAPHERGKAFYDDGLKTDSRDERGSYSYGSKEVWYLNSVESKTMIATFVLDDVERKDAHGVLNNNGGRNASQKLYRLKQINLYSKADYIKKGPADAKPIKSVHFSYSYRLCKGTPDSEADSGKLTLERVWFTYNKNKKGERNPYIFTYHANNPGHDSKKNDRWGNYKNPANNPGTTGGPLTNADYPYTLQQGVNTWNKDSADYNAGAWTLTDVKLPSGGKIKVSYEADDYAYVQNRRAMQLFSLAGFGETASSTPVNNLYPPNTSAKDYEYAFVNITEQVTSKADITRKYLEGVSRLFFKVQVKVPADIWGKGYETVPCYAGIEDYGVKGNPADKIIWIKLKAIEQGAGSIATTVLQFLRLNMPSKAYPYSEPGDQVSFRNFLGTLATVATNFNDVFNGYPRRVRRDNYCNDLLLEKSFVRLNNPVYRKLGGGLRVKKVEVYDHFNTMTGGQQQEAKYGQEYDYNTSIDIDGVPTTISSGVATYEPMVGNDENPFRVPIEFTEQMSAWAPVNYMYAEEPFAETFFPSPSVGYSKVRVQSIHKDKKSATGAEETEYYTAKDFPTLVEWTPLDPETKRRFKPDLNVLKMNAKHFITLSQGFKVELNNMHGQIKSQASFANNNLKDPISYTKNYYRLENDASGKPKLSNTVQLVDSANGKIRTGTIGKEVELMVDVREQSSYTVGGSVQSNLDFMHVPPPIFSVSVIPLPNFETNRYRSISVLKIVNRYGILDSMIHMEKGSVISTRNKVFDSETGDVLLTETNNEFDDPVNNFAYPAHWAYSGMGPAYKNLGTRIQSVKFRRGLLFKDATRLPTERYFESGDEIWVTGKYTRVPLTNDYCNPLYYTFIDISSIEPGTRIWAVEAGKGKEGHKGIYFVDKDGKPFSGDIDQLTIIRSGRRNMAGADIGAVTSMKSPVKTVNGQLRLVFDSTISVIAASAVSMKDFWRVDSTNYAKDTTVIGSRLAFEHEKISLRANDNFTIRYYKDAGLFKKHKFQNVANTTAVEASAKDFGGNGSEEEKKSWIKFNFDSIPKGAVIISANLFMFGHSQLPHLNERGTSNNCYVERLRGPWIRPMVAAGGDGAMKQYFDQNGNGLTDATTRATIPATASNGTPRHVQVEVTAMVQAMLDNYYASNKTVDPAMLMRLVNNGGANNGSINRLAYNTPFSNFCIKDHWNIPDRCGPQLDITYYEPCNNSVKPTFSNTPVPGYYCYDVPIDSFICKPNINDTAVNPYRWGIFGNWRVESPFVYFNRRKESDPLTATNIRTDGEIKGFMPFWSFTDSVLNASADSSRWVWTTKATAFNSKGFELEHTDPLGRFNAGQYGYNKTLPVAVGQNTKSREMVFDGFEDYGFKTDTCKKCIDNRFIELAGGGTLIDTVSHTGKYSLRLNGNQTLSKTIPIATQQQDTLAHNLSLRLDSVAKVVTTVNGNGTGLSLRYRDNNVRSCTQFQFRDVPFTTNINRPPSKNTAPGGCNFQYFSMTFDGYIQPRYTGMYYFWVRSDDRMEEIDIYRNGVKKSIVTDVIKNNKWDAASYNAYYKTDTIYLEAGELYRFHALFHQYEGNWSYMMDWESEGVQSQTREPVPVSLLYPITTNTATAKALTTDNDTTWCIGFSNVKPTKITNDRFSPLQGKKVVVSAWVKQEMLCINGNYDYVQLELTFNNAGQNFFLLKPKGYIIEGWQRIEETITIPVTATSLSFSMRSTSSSPVYFDDIRVHPFNANMKSFVFNPVNIRLMAELDENNYATFFEYDDEGTLTRVKKETERGIKTIKETRSALLKE